MLSKRHTPDNTFHISADWHINNIRYKKHTEIECPPPRNHLREVREHWWTLCCGSLTDMPEPGLSRDDSFWRIPSLPLMCLGWRSYLQSSSFMFTANGRTLSLLSLIFWYRCHLRNVRFMRSSLPGGHNEQCATGAIEQR